MKAIRVHAFGDPDVMELEEVPDPRAGPGQVVVAIRAIGVNPFDAYIRAGTYAFKPALPYTPGADAAGIVESVGDGVTRFKAGDRVYIAGTLSGAYAERALCDAKTVHPLPASIDFPQGAALGVPYATAYRALFIRGGAKPAESVLIHGASGGVGTAATQLARAAGLTVIGTASTERGRQLARDNGAHDVLDHSAGDYLKSIMDLTMSHGVDIILEMLANVNLGKDLTVLAHKGRVVVVGNRGEVMINPRDAMGRDADIRAMTLMVATDAELAEIHAAIRAGLEMGALRPVIGQQIPLAEAPRAHRAVMEPGAYGKIILVP